MTSFVAWVGVDSRGSSSLYLASDSRVSWGPKDTWDYGRKVFATTTSPDVLGYIGDVLFPSLVLGQVVAAIDARTLYPLNSLPEDRFACIRKAIQASFSNLPSLARNPFTVVYGTRENEGMGSHFRLWRLAWDPNSKWTEEHVPLPTRSSALWVLGSGTKAIREWQSRWDSSSQGGTSRAVFSAFCDAIHSRTDPLTGGAPQLVALYRKDPAQTIGVVIDRSPYLFGLPVDAVLERQSSELQWRNHLFERVDTRGVRLLKAQHHHAPKGLGKSCTAKSLK